MSNESPTSITKGSTFQPALLYSSRVRNVKVGKMIEEQITSTVKEWYYYYVVQNAFVFGSFSSVLKVLGIQFFKEGKNEVTA